MSNYLPDDPIHAALLRLVYERRALVRAARAALAGALVELEKAAEACELLRVPVPPDDAEAPADQPPCAATSEAPPRPPTKPVIVGVSPGAAAAAAEPLKRKRRAAPRRVSDSTTKRIRDSQRIRDILQRLIRGPCCVQELARLLGESGETVRGVLKKQGRRRLGKAGVKWYILPEALEAVRVDLGFVAAPGSTSAAPAADVSPMVPVFDAAMVDAVVAYMTRVGVPVMAAQIAAAVPYKQADVLRLISADVRFVRRNGYKWTLRSLPAESAAKGTQLPLPTQAPADAQAPVAPTAQEAPVAPTDPEAAQTTGSGTDTVYTPTGTAQPPTRVCENAGTPCASMSTGWPIT